MEFWTDLADWAWSRHHNEWSWYIRPFIILGFCAAAWMRNRLGVILIGLSFPIGAIMFPAPQTPKPYVVDFLMKEREMLEGLSLFGWALFAGATVLFLWLLAATLWKRSFWFGIAVANLGGVIKLTVSVFLWAEIGNTAILPTVVTAGVFNVCAIAAWWWLPKSHRLAS